jgi:hypothetical protein
MLISAAHLYQKANYQDFQRFQQIDLVIPADAEATLPYLVQAVKRLVPADRKDAMAARGERLAAAHRQMIKTIKDEAIYGWDASPIATSRLAAELWEAIRREDWSIGAISSNNRHDNGTVTGLAQSIHCVSTRRPHDGMRPMAKRRPLRLEPIREASIQGLERIR